MTKCSVEGCENEAGRSLSLEKAGNAIKKARLSIPVNRKVRRVHLCKEHHRAIKKFLRKEREIERKRWL